MTKDLSQTSKSSFKTKITCTKSWKSDHKITFLMKLSQNVPLFTTWIKRISPPVLKYLWEQDRKTDLLSLALPVQPGCLTHTLSSFGLTSSVIHFYLRPKHTEVVRSMRKQWIDSASQSSLLQVPSTYNSAWPMYWRAQVCTTYWQK